VNVATKSIELLHREISIPNLSPCPPLPTPIVTKDRWLSMSEPSSPSIASITSCVSIVVPLGADPLLIRALEVMFLVVIAVTVGEPPRSALISIAKGHVSGPVPALAWVAAKPIAKTTPVMEPQIPDLRFAYRHLLPRKPSLSWI